MSANALAWGLALARAQAALQRRLDERLGEWHGLDLPTYLLLLELAPAVDGLPLRTLAQRVHGTPAAVLRQLLPLEKTGLIERAGGKVLLRAAGRGLLSEASQTAEALYDKALAALGPEAAALQTGQAALQRLAAYKV